MPIYLHNHSGTSHGGNCSGAKPQGGDPTVRVTVSNTSLAIVSEFKHCLQDYTQYVSYDSPSSHIWGGGARRHGERCVYASSRTATDSSTLSRSQSHLCQVLGAIVSP